MTDITGVPETSSLPPGAFEELPVVVREAIVGIKVVMGMIILVTNLVMLYGLIMARGLKPTLRFGLVNLTVTDALAGAIYCYHALASKLIKQRTLECDIRYGVLTLTVSVTFCTLVMMSLDRVFALYLPYRYEAIMTTRNLIVWVALNWLSSLGIMISGVLRTHRSDSCQFVANSTPSKLLSFSVPSLVTTGVIVFLQALVFSTTVRQTRKTIPAVVGDRESRSIIQGLRLHMKATVTTGMVVLPFVVLTAPLYCVFSYLAANPGQMLLPSSLYVVDACLFLQALNGLVNPAIYIWRLSEVRARLRIVLCRDVAATSSSSSGASDRF